jgi:predicted ATPase/DNA-binding SARP family transcriptional activator
MEGRWQIELLGGLRVTRGDQVIERVSGEKPAQLLAYHLRSTHSRDALADLLWPDAVPEVARHRLSQTLTTLRKHLAPLTRQSKPVLLCDRRCVRLDAARVTTDVRAFEAALDRAARTPSEAEREALLLEAIDRYRGELLPGCYESWALLERERLAERHAQALQSALALREGRDDLPGALDLARRVLVADPLAEEAHRAVVRLLVAQGDPAAALRQYRQMERLLGAERNRTLADRVRFYSRRSGGPPPSAVPGGRLPPLRNRFFGRAAEIETPIALLRSGERLVTLTGPGGSGKTRLALEVATRCAEKQDRPVWHVPLADLADPEHLLETIRDALGMPRVPRRDTLEQLMAVLGRERPLLLLDNFEHLVTGGSALLRAIVEAAPGLTCLVTSRRLLNLAEERELWVPPLPQEPSVDLFIDRARAARPGFAATGETAEAIARLCERLEGIPLAIELAAARASLLAPAQILAHLGDRFRFLVSRRQAEEPRHQTLWAALEWSYRLLPPEVQRFFASLSAFRGGWTLDAARGVCRAPDALDFLEQLRDSSMIEVSERAGKFRFRMLETLREFGWEQLAPEERAELERRHAAYYLALAEEAEPALFRSQQAQAFARVEADHDNLRAALVWSEAAPDRIETGLRLSAALWWFWFIRGYLAEGWGWIDRALGRAAGSGETPARAKALCGAGGIAWFRGEHVTARHLMEESVAIWRRLGERRGLGIALRAFGWVALDQGDLEAARAAVEESLRLFRELGDEVYTARSLHFLGRAAYLAGEREAGRARLEEGVARCRALADDLILCWGLEALGKVALDNVEPAEAARHYQESLAISRRLGALRGVARSLEGLACVAALKGHASLAARLFGAARACRDTQGIAALPVVDWQTDHDRHVRLAQADLGATAYARACSEGMDAGWERAAAEVETALPFTAAPAPGTEEDETGLLSRPQDDLTDAQWEPVRALLASTNRRGRPRADARRTRTRASPSSPRKLMKTLPLVIGSRASQVVRVQSIWSAEWAGSAQAE